MFSRCRVGRNNAAAAAFIKGFSRLFAEEGTTTFPFSAERNFTRLDWPPDNHDGPSSAMNCFFDMQSDLRTSFTCEDRYRKIKKKKKTVQTSGTSSTRNKEKLSRQTVVSFGVLSPRYLLCTIALIRYVPRSFWNYALPHARSVNITIRFNNRLIDINFRLKLKFPWIKISRIDEINTIDFPLIAGLF